MCSDGDCDCPAGEELCEGTCVDTQTDNDHCGACGAECNGEPECEAGTCTGCEGTLTACGDACVDTSSDEDHCGGCEDDCEDDETCIGGGCTPDVETEPCTPDYTVPDVADSVTTPNFGTTGPYCIKVNMSCVGGWGCNNTSGRTVQVNDTPMTCGDDVPAKVNGAYYFEFSAGSWNYASLTLWKGSCDD